MRRKKNDSAKQPRGYGNIYTPHAGSMIIQVQREGGLANRTIVLSERQVKLLRFVTSRSGKLVLLGVLASWLYFAVEATRVPLLSRRLAHMEHNAQRLDTLQTTLGELQKRYEQVTRMLGVTPSSATQTLDTAEGAVAIESATPTAAPVPTLPTEWPLAGKGYVTRGVGGASDGAAHPGLDVAVALNTPVRAAGGGSVVEVGQNAEYGNFVRVKHTDGYETIYGHASRVIVHKGDRVAQGQVIALSGNTGRSTAPHLHFEVRHNGTVVDPMQLIKRDQ